MVSTTTTSPPPNHLHHQHQNGGSSGETLPHLGDFYAGKTVFITGGTGFMGKVLLEKMLRCCPAVGRIYLLIRPKKGQAPQDRLDQLLACPLFDLVRKHRPETFSKVLPIEGDITQPDLAIASSDRALLAASVHVVFHSAATVKFDEKLKLSVTINVLGTQRLIELCKLMVELRAIVHVSTAYCNCDRAVIGETVYAPPIEPRQVTALVEGLDEALIDSITPKLIGRRPNTYTFTKALAECWLKENASGLPLAIVRPSIVLCTAQGPNKGWVDNWNGPTGIIAAAGKGIFRSMLGDPDKTVDLVPVDVVINLMLTAACHVAVARPKPLQVYNCVTSNRRPISWHRFIDLSLHYLRRHPSSDMLWYPGGRITSSQLLHSVSRALLQWLPAWVMDACVRTAGGKPIMLRIQDKLAKAAKCLEYFTSNQWQFEDDNMRELAGLLAPEDRAEFGFDVEAIDWEDCIEHYAIGIRRFLFKEDESTLARARKQAVRLYWMHRCLQLASLLVVWQLLALRFGPLKHIWQTGLRFLLHFIRMIPFI